MGKPNDLSKMMVPDAESEFVRGFPKEFRSREDGGIKIQRTPHLFQRTSSPQEYVESHLGDHFTRPWRLVAYLWQDSAEKGGNPSKLAAIRLAKNPSRQNVLGLDRKGRTSMI